MRGDLLPKIPYTVVPRERDNIYVDFNFFSTISQKQNTRTNLERE
jgi:hypothetical protein